MLSGPVALTNESIKGGGGESEEEWTLNRRSGTRT